MPEKPITGEVNVTLGDVTSSARVIISEPLPASHPFYLDIGRVASAWSHVEHTLDLIIWHLADIHMQVGACMTSQIMGVGPRCKAIHLLGLTEGLSEELLRSVRKLMSDSYSIADQRARVIHDPWYSDRGTGIASQFKAMPYSDPRLGFIEVTKEEIEYVLKGIAGLQFRAHLLRNKITVELQALREPPA